MRRDAANRIRCLLRKQTTIYYEQQQEGPSRWAISAKVRHVGGQ